MVNDGTSGDHAATGNDGLTGTADLIDAYRAPATARQMYKTATAFLAALSPAQRAGAMFPFPGDERYLWSYRPDTQARGIPFVRHGGVRLVHMTAPQQDLAFELLDLMLSPRGTKEARSIMTLESTLREVERLAQIPKALVRDPELYAWSLFGEPTMKGTWGWRVGGHHVAVNVTVIEGSYVAPTPLFFGAMPATVPHGANIGHRTLPQEEDMARSLVQSFNDDQRAIAVVSSSPPIDILTEAHKTAYDLAIPRGLPFAQMSADQRELFVRLIRHYIGRASDEIAANEWREIESLGLNEVTFAWAGSEQPGQGHYYAVRGPTFLLEYDKVADNANHVHTVWRKFNGDWGEDILAAHYRQNHPH